MPFHLYGSLIQVLACEVPNNEAFIHDCDLCDYCVVTWQVVTMLMYKGARI